MTGRYVKAVAVIVNLALLGLAIFFMTRPDFELQGLSVLLFMLIVLTPVVNLGALYWPGRPQPPVPAPDAATERQG